VGVQQPFYAAPFFKKYFALIPYAKTPSFFVYPFLPARAHNLIYPNHTLKERLKTSGILDCCTKLQIAPVLSQGKSIANRSLTEFFNGLVVFLRINHEENPKRFNLTMCF